MRERAKGVNFLAETMTVVCQLMHERGISRSHAEELSKASLARAYTHQAKRSRRENQPITMLADVCTRWHIDKKYLDKTGKPMPLSWDGKRGTLLQLVRGVCGRRDAHRHVQRLVDRRLISAVGKNRWIPVAKVVSPGGMDDAQILRATDMLSSFIRTVEHNSARRYRGNQLNLEVLASVPRLPVRNVSAFRRFTKTQGLSFVKAADDWMESRNIKRSIKGTSARTREVGVIAFSFVGSPAGSK
jgi:hypothetical protein